MISGDIPIELDVSWLIMKTIVVVLLMKNFQSTVQENLNQKNQKNEIIKKTDN